MLLTSFQFFQKNKVFSQESDVDLFGIFYKERLEQKNIVAKNEQKGSRNCSSHPHLISIKSVILLTQYWKTSTLEKTNNELLKKLEETTQELASLQENYTDLQKILNVNLNPPIETRLTIELMENGQRYQKISLGNWRS